MSLNTLSELRNHPKGLFVLFFVEIWERFSYYGMRAILILFLVSSVNDENPGMGWSRNDALALYGWYTALVYFACIPGGIIADRLIGKKKSLLIGGFFLCFGHLCLALQNNLSFFLGLILIILGVGLLKPNISSLVGSLYKQRSNIREQGFTIFYIGINLGAFFSSIIVGYVGEVFGWHYGFGLAGIGMIIGQIFFLKGQKYIPNDRIINKNDIKENRLNLNFTKVEIDRIKLLVISFLIIIIFWSAFEQAGGLMNLYAYEKTDRSLEFLNNWVLPASWFQSVNPLLIILLGLPISSFWLIMKKKGFNNSSLFKMSVGLGIMGLGFIFMFFASNEFIKNGSSAIYWILLAYLFHTIGELCASPVVLSYITKLAPVRYVSSIMGIYFASMGLGNKLASTIGQYSEKLGESQTFLLITFFCVFISLIIMFFIKKLEKLAHNADS